MFTFICYSAGMYHFVCDMCGKGLLLDEDVRYEVNIEVKSAYDPMELTRDDLKRDFQNELLSLMAQLKLRTQQELEDEVYKSFKFDLCLSCQKKYIRNPLMAKGQDCKFQMPNSK